MNNPRTPIWQENGKEFGYPQCCIDDFCGRTFFSEADENQQKVGENGFGFIPCPEHAKQIVEGTIKIESLIKNRNPDFAPFPNE